jgi:amidase
LTVAADTSIFIDRTEIGRAGTRVAVKDLIDIAGQLTTGGCRAIALTAEPAISDADCLAGTRAEVENGHARFVGKTNLSELAVGTIGINPWYGTPSNPIDPALIPGGSSSGSAVAVAIGEADVGIGTDTSGSVRIPAACCGVAGLKTTHGRIPVTGVLPAAQSFDIVGPLARDVSGIVRGMELLEPGFTPATQSAWRIGRVRIEDVDPRIDQAVDTALARSGYETVEIDLPGWSVALQYVASLTLAELWRNHSKLIETSRNDLGPEFVRLVSLGAPGCLGKPLDELGGLVLPDLATSREGQSEWRRQLEAAFSQVDLLATPTLTGFPPPLTDLEKTAALPCTSQLNLAGVPALALPIPTEASLPASLQLIGPMGGEELLVAAAAAIESQAGWHPPLG